MSELARDTPIVSAVLPLAPQLNATYVPHHAGGPCPLVSWLLAFGEHDNVPLTGNPGTDHAVTSGPAMARVCALNLLAPLQHVLGELAGFGIGSVAFGSPVELDAILRVRTA